MSEMLKLQDMIALIHQILAKIKFIYNYIHRIQNEPPKLP